MGHCNILLKLLPRYGRSVVTQALVLGMAAVLSLAALGSASAQDTDDQADIRVLVDVSGSMKTNDPNRLAVSAMDMLVALLPNGVHAGIWTFGEHVDNPLPLAPVEESWKKQALSLPPALQDYQQYTDIEAALRVAAASDGHGPRHLVLMTDGVVDLPPSRGAKPAIDVASRQRILDAISPDLVNQDTAVHAIAFSAGADAALVERLAQQSGGLAAVVDSPEELLGAFLDIIGRILPTDQLPLDGNRFTVNGSADEIAPLIFHGPDDGGKVTLIAPDGTRYSAESPPPGGSWQQDPRFDLIRVPNPQQGEWRIEGPVGEGSRIMVSGGLRLATQSLPTTLYSSFSLPLQAWVEGDSDAELPDNLSITARLVRANEEASQSITLERSSDGRFNGVLPAPQGTGNARLVIDARGDDFRRQRIQAVNILPAVGAAQSEDGQRVILVAEHPDLDRDNTTFSSDLRGESLDVEATGRRRWQIVLPEIEEHLRQPLEIEATAQLEDGEHRWKLATVWLNADEVVGIDRATAGPTLAGERFAEADPSPPPAENSLADRFVALVNEGPQRLMDWWQAGHPGLEEAIERIVNDIRVWIGVAVVLLLMVWRRWRRKRVMSRKRQEPHV